MSPELGSIRFEGVGKRFRLGSRRAYLSAALPFGDGGGGGRELWALKDVSFEVPPGESFAIIGHNGAGKSTALKCLSGVTPPTRGRIHVGGKISALIELGVGFHPDLSGVENLRFAAAIAGLRGKAVDAAVEQAIDFAEVDAFLDTPVKRYSSGMLARIGFGIATALPGDILIVDEVLSVGDAAFQRKCQRRLAELRKGDGRTLLFVSHNEWVVKETCSRAALLDHGRLVCVAPVQEALTQYARLQVDNPLGKETTAGSGKALVEIRAVELQPDTRERSPDDPLTIRCVLQVQEEAEQPVVAACLLNEAGHIVWGVYSDEIGMRLEAGPNTVRIDIERIAAQPGACRLQVFTFDRAIPLVEEIYNIDLEVVGPATGMEHGIVRVPAVMERLEG